MRRLSVSGLTCRHRGCVIWRSVVGLACAVHAPLLSRLPFASAPATTPSALARSLDVPIAWNSVYISIGCWATMAAAPSSAVPSSSSSSIAFRSSLGCVAASSLPIDSINIGTHHFDGICDCRLVSLAVWRVGDADEVARCLIQSMCESRLR